MVRSITKRCLPRTNLQSVSEGSSRASTDRVEANLEPDFSQVLGREQVGVNDNFFRLGGHSLLAAQAAARIKEAFGLGLELRTFLESPTVAALAKHIATRIKPAYPTTRNRRYGSRGDRAMNHCRVRLASQKRWTFGLAPKGNVFA